MLISKIPYRFRHKTMSFEQQVECEAKILRQEIRNLKASLNNVTQRL